MLVLIIFRIFISTHASNTIFIAVDMDEQNQIPIKIILNDGLKLKNYTIMQV